MSYFFDPLTRLFLTIILSIFLFMTSLHIYTSFQQFHHDGKILVKELSIGKLIKTEYLKPVDFFTDDTQTVIITEQGSFLVRGAAVIKNDMPLQKQSMKNGSSRICDPSACWWMINDGEPK